MNEEIKEHISSLINNFNNMTYEEQQEELLELYKTGEIDYVNIVERHSNLAKEKRQLQNNWNKLKEYISNNNRYFEKADLEMVSNVLNGLDILSKMQELEGVLNE